MSAEDIGGNGGIRCPECGRPTMWRGECVACAAGWDA